MPPLWLFMVVPSFSVVVFQYLEQRDKALKLNQALQYCGEVGKPMLNVGCGDNPRVIGDVNIDIHPVGVSIIPRYIQASIYDLPFRDKEAGAACAFSVIEHVERPQEALAELSRVADRVYVTVPYPLDFSTYFHFDHKWTFIGSRAVRINPAGNWLTAGSIGFGLGLAYFGGRA